LTSQSTVVAIAVRELESIQESACYKLQNRIGCLLPLKMSAWKAAFLHALKWIVLLGVALIAEKALDAYFLLFKDHPDFVVSRQFWLESHHCYLVGILQLLALALLVFRYIVGSVYQIYEAICDHAKAEEPPSDLPNHFGKIGKRHAINVVMFVVPFFFLSYMAALSLPRFADFCFWLILIPIWDGILGFSFYPFLRLGRWVVRTSTGAALAILLLKAAWLTLRGKRDEAIKLLKLYQQAHASRQDKQDFLLPYTQGPHFIRWDLGDLFCLSLYPIARWVVQLRPSSETSVVQWWSWLEEPWVAAYLCFAAVVLISISCLVRLRLHYKNYFILLFRVQGG
jgi:hypothetical protein